MCRYKSKQRQIYINDKDRDEFENAVAVEAATLIRGLHTDERMESDVM